MYVENANRAANDGCITMKNLEPNPKNLEGDVFRIIVPLDDQYSFDFETTKSEKNINDKIDSINDADKMPISADKMPVNALSAQQMHLFQFITENGRITSHQAKILLGVKQRRARVILGEMVDLGVLERQGSYILKDESGREK